jgi:solute carrier family 13 (sodium-dependent dicarboxylate transporter), member 2/3/5
VSRRSAIGLALALLAAVAVLLVPAPALSPAAHRLGAIWIAVVVLWISEALPLPVTALLAPTAAILAGVAGPREAFAAFGDPVLFLLLGSFLLARAFEVTGLGRRLALRLLTLPGVAGRPLVILPLYGLLCFALSMWTSNTATAALMYPIGLSVLAALEPPGGRGDGRYASALLLLCTFGASIGGLATPVGTPPNMIGLGLLERALGARPSFLEWMAVMLPVALVLQLAMTAVFLLSVRGDPAARPRPTPGLVAERTALGPWTSRERGVAAIFGATIVLWLVPGSWALAAGADDAVARRLATLLPESAVALLGAAFLFAVPAGGRPVLTWDEGRGIDWGTIVLFGGGICLGGLLLSTGLGEAIADALRRATGAHDALGVTALVVVLAVFLSESSSNTASATLIVPIAIALATRLDIDPTVPALAATAASSLGFMLPVSTAPNAIVFGSGRIRLATMARYGLLLDLLGIVVLIAVAAAFVR